MSIEGVEEGLSRHYYPLLLSLVKALRWEVATELHTFLIYYAVHFILLFFYCAKITLIFLVPFSLLLYHLFTLWEENHRERLLPEDSKKVNSFLRIYSNDLRWFWAQCRKVYIFAKNDPFITMIISCVFMLIFNALFSIFFLIYGTVFWMLLKPAFLRFHLMGY